METLEKIAICQLHELVPFEGRAALVDGEQVALFLVPNKGVYAVQNWDPIGQAYVLSRGIVGDKQGELCVASPLYKQHFSLVTGRCIEETSVVLKCWQVTTDANSVYLSV
jgi:nitrite reductase (NADH) small subunit